MPGKLGLVLKDCLSIHEQTSELQQEQVSIGKDKYCAIKKVQEIMGTGVWVNRKQKVQEMSSRGWKLEFR